MKRSHWNLTSVLLLALLLAAVFSNPRLSSWMAEPVKATPQSLEQRVSQLEQRVGTIEAQRAAEAKAAAKAARDAEKAAQGPKN